MKPIAFAILFYNLLLSLSIAQPECHEEDRSEFDDTSVLQTSSAVASGTSRLLLEPDEKHSEAWYRNLSKAPSGTRIIANYNSCPYHAHPYFEKTQFYIHEASRTHLVHIYKSAGTVIFESINASGGAEQEYGHRRRAGFTGGVLDQGKQWFKAAVVRDPLTRSLDGFHEIWKRLYCLPPVGHCRSPKKNSGINWGCEPCLESHPEQMGIWIQRFNEEILNIESFMGRGLPENNVYAHVLPQLSFLTLNDGSKADLDYLGSLDELEREVPFIFNSEVALAKNIKASGGFGPADKNQFRIEPNQLQAETLVQICNYYYADYCCFGFEFPEACKQAGFACGSVMMNVTGF